MHDWAAARVGKWIWLVGQITMSFMGQIRLVGVAAHLSVTWMSADPFVCSLCEIKSSR